MIRVVDVGWSFVSVFALDGGDGVVLVDSHYEDHERRILRRLERAGIEADRITLILLTHGHSDHVGSAEGLARRLGVPIVVGAGDAAALPVGTVGDLPFTSGFARALGATFHQRWEPFEADLVVTDRLDLAPYGVAGEARVVGGHTPGSLVVTLPDGVVLVGDLVRGGLVHQHAPALHFVHTDAVAAHAALDALLAGGFTTFWPSHGKELSAERMERWLAGPRRRHEQRMERREP